MTISRSRRTTTITALVATALGGGALAASAVSATGTTHTSLSIRAQRSHVAAGHSDHIAGNLRAADKPAAGETVTLEARPSGSGHFSAAGTATTGPHGRVVFTVAPTATTRYALRFAGDSADHASHSGVVTVRVAGSGHHRRLGSALAIHVGRHSIPLGASDHIAGRLTHRHHGLRGRHVILQSRAPKTTTWTAVADHVTGVHGRVGYTVSPTSTTRYRLVFAGGELLRPSRSPGRTVEVRTSPTPSSLSIRGKQVATGENVSGVLRGGGHAIRDRRVTLQSEASGSATWSPVRTQRTGRHGLVRFHVATPTVTTSYRLVFAGGARYDGSTSGIVTVTES
jgi:hypothetical protein